MIRLIEFLAVNGGRQRNRNIYLILLAQIFLSTPREQPVSAGTDRKSAQPSRSSSWRAEGTAVVTDVSSQQTAVATKHFHTPTFHTFTFIFFTFLDAQSKVQEK